MAIEDEGNRVAGLLRDLWKTQTSGISAVVTYPWSRSCPGNSARSNGLQELSEWNVTAFKILSFIEVTVVESTPKISCRMAGWSIHDTSEQGRKNYKLFDPTLSTNAVFPEPLHPTMTTKLPDERLPGNIGRNETEKAKETASRRKLWQWKTKKQEK